MQKTLSQIKLFFARQACILFDWALIYLLNDMNEEAVVSLKQCYYWWDSCIQVLKMSHVYIWEVGFLILYIMIVDLTFFCSCCGF